jgi:ABC-type Fe3+/spermidine/putrescine transport system ATPase subunit
MTAALAVDRLTKHFPGADGLALDAVGLEVADRSFTCLLGASGSGKSTLLACIAGLLDADEGEVLLDGRSLTGVPAHRRPLTLVLQQSQLMPFLDVADNVAFGLRVRGVDKRTRRRRAGELLDAVGLGGFGGRRVGSLSGGEAQRVAFARALVIEPRVLLLDEPLSSLDPGVRRDLQELLAELHQQMGTTTVMVTHDRDEAFALADHLVVLHNGRVVADGPPRAIYAQPPTAAVARILGLSTGAGGEVLHPERISLLPSGAGSAEATVMAVRFAGALTEVRVQTADGRTVTALVASADAPDVGATVSIDLR